MTQDNALALRVDDVGACTKRYEVYSKRSWGVGSLRISGDWLFVKYVPWFKAWGPYREMTAREWYAVYELLARQHATLTVAVTAAWAEAEGDVIPFPVRFPQEASALKEGVEQGLLEIANHGLTHCVVAGNAFKPRWFSSNRLFHREFWAWVPAEIHEQHLARSQQILEDYFQIQVVTFVPPGNVFTDETLKAASGHGIQFVSCNAEPGERCGLTILGNAQTLEFHDRDIVRGGVEWLEQTLRSHPGRRFCTVRELAAARHVPIAQ